MSDVQPVGELLQELGKSSRDLIVSEIRLARAEIVEAVGEARRGLVWILVALVPAAMALLMVPMAMVYALDNVMPQWAAAGLVALVMLALATLLAYAGLRHLKRADPVPHQTVETVQEDVQWVKDRLS